MDRKRVEELLKDILDNCPVLNNSAISVMPPDSSSVVSKGYQIHIKDPALNEEALCCLRGIAEKHNTAIRQEKQQLIIYKPLTG